MENKSLKQLQKHLRFCKKCQNAKNTTKLCKIVKNYATQDYTRQKELSLEQQNIEKTSNQSWTEYISENAPENINQFTDLLLQNLTALDRKIIYLYFWKGKTHRKISSELGYQAHSYIQRRITKSKKLLKTYLPSEIKKYKQLQEVIEKRGQITITEGEKKS